MKLEMTSDYSKFEMNEFNRDVKKTRKLETLMKREGWVPAYPLHVRKGRNGKYVIIGGHHRFYVAQKINCPVVFVCCTDNLQTYEIEEGTNPWKLPDYLSGYVHMGDVDYMAVQELSRKLGVGVGVAAGVLSNEVNGGGNKTQMFKRGEYKVTTPELAETIGEIILLLKSHGHYWGREQIAAHAISRIVKAGGADITKLKRKINKFSHTLKKQASLKDYTVMFEELYNRNEGKRVPLAFITDEAMKQFSAAIAGGKAA